MSSWDRLFEFGFSKLDIKKITKNYPSVYEYALNNNENSKNIVFKEFDSIFLLIEFGMTLEVAKQLSELGINSIHISMRRSSRKLIENQQKYNHDNMLRQLYHARSTFEKWLASFNAQEELQKYVWYYRQTKELNEKNFESNLNATVMFFNKHFATSLDAKSNNNIESNSKQQNKNKLSVNNTIALVQHNIASSGYAENLIKRNSKEKSSSLAEDDKIQLFWLLDFNISTKLYMEIKSKHLSLTRLLKNIPGDIPVSVDNQEMRTIRKHVKLKGLLKDSISFLVGFGVSPRIVKSLKEQGITKISQLTTTKFSNLILPKYFKEQAGGENELNFLSHAVQKYYEWKINVKFNSYILGLIVVDNNGEVVNIPESKLDKKSNYKVINSRVSDFEKKQCRIRKRIFGFDTLPETIVSFLNLEMKPDTDRILRGRISGETLQELADKLGITRERVRQKELIIKNNMPKFSEEEKLKKILSLYYFDDNEFTKIFKLDDIINSFMVWRYGRGERPSFEFVMNNNKISDKVKIWMLNHHNLMKTPDGTFLIQSVNNILDIVLSEHETRQLNVNELTQLYNDYIERNGLDNSFKKKPTELLKLTRSDYRTAIKSTNGKFRYFDFSKINDDILEQLSFILNVPAGMYGIKYFYDNNLKLMHELSLQNPAELANLYKRIGYKQFPRLVDIIRQSQVMIDTKSKDEFMLSAIFDYDNQPLSNLINYFSDVYGLQATTMRSLVLNNYRQYITGDTIIAEVKLPNNTKFYEEAEMLLTHPIYDRSEFEKIIHKLDNSLTLTERLANRLGYRERGNYGLLVQNKFSSAVSAVNYLLFRNNVFDAKTSPNLKSSRLLKFKIYEYEVQHDLVKISETKYMTSRFLAEKGITKIKLENFIDAVNDFVIQDEFFTLKSLLESGFSHALFDLGFDSIFYERLIFTSDKIRMLNIKGCVFVKPLNLVDYRPSLLDFIEFIMGDCTSIGMNDLQSKILNVYGIEISNYKISEKISAKTSNMVYSPELNRIFLSHENMLDFIYN